MIRSKTIDLFVKDSAVKNRCHLTKVQNYFSEKETKAGYN
uniref:Uncharacterized protein n=1 Tax=Arundo donax TaxID=35708 RepID=A0A0A9AGV4_ARUDO